MSWERNDHPMLVVVEGLAYFGTGHYLVRAVCPYLRLAHGTQPSVDSVLSWLSLIIGVVLIIGGFAALTTVMLPAFTAIISVIRKTRLVTGFGYRRLSGHGDLFRRFRPLLFAVAFSITTTQLMPLLLDSRVLLLSAVSALFFVYLALAILYISRDILARRTGLLVQITVAFTVMLLIRVLQDAGRTETCVGLSIIIVFLILILLSVRRGSARQLPLLSRRGFLSRE